MYLGDGCAGPNDLDTSEMSRASVSDSGAGRLVFDDDDCRGVIRQMGDADVDFPTRKYPLGPARHPDGRPRTFVVADVDFGPADCPAQPGQLE